MFERIKNMFNIKQKNIDEKTNSVEKNTMSVDEIKHNLAEIIDQRQQAFKVQNEIKQKITQEYIEKIKVYGCLFKKKINDYQDIWEIFDMLKSLENNPLIGEKTKQPVSSLEDDKLKIWISKQCVFCNIKEPNHDRFQFNMYFGKKEEIYVWFSSIYEHNHIDFFKPSVTNTFKCTSYEVQPDSNNYVGVSGEITDITDYKIYIGELFDWFELILSGLDKLKDIFLETCTDMILDKQTITTNHEQK